MVDLNKGGVKFGKVQNHLHKKMLTARQNQTTAGRAQFLRNSILIVVVENCLKVLLSGFFWKERLYWRYMKRYSDYDIKAVKNQGSGFLSPLNWADFS